MISPPKQSQRAEFSCRAVRWLWPTALLALAPKCLLCVLVYAGLGAALGLGGPEICGATDASLSWTTVLAWLGAVGAVTGVGLRARFRCGRWAHPRRHQ